MPYIGQQPAPKVVTSSDLADDVVTADKIGDTAISGFNALLGWAPSLFGLIKGPSK